MSASSELHGCTQRERPLSYLDVGCIALEEIKRALREWVQFGSSGGPGASEGRRAWFETREARMIDVARSLRQNERGGDRTPTNQTTFEGLLLELASTTLRCARSEFLAETAAASDVRKRNPVRATKVLVTYGEFLITPGEMKAAKDRLAQPITTNRAVALRLNRGIPRADGAYGVSDDFVRHARETVIRGFGRPIDSQHYLDRLAGQAVILRYIWRCATNNGRLSIKSEQLRELFACGEALRWYAAADDAVGKQLMTPPFLDFPGSLRTTEYYRQCMRLSQNRLGILERELARRAV